MEFVADLHLHSKYSRAVSQDMILPIMAAWARRKGLGVISAADWTHPLWLREIREQLEEVSEGLYALKSAFRGNKYMHLPKDEKDPLFILSVEIASIYNQDGKLRRIHNLVLAPNFTAVEKINKELLSRGCNLMSDGRPIIGLSSHNLLELVLNADPRAMLIPCHIWTPHFGVYGSASGFDSLDEGFKELSEYIYGIETGLSSDPEMNWQVRELQSRSILSFSDAHSPAKMGREATVFVRKDGMSNLKSQISNSKMITYEDIRLAIMKKDGRYRIGYTVEFYPEEGKYHFSGHRNCKVVLGPEEIRTQGNTCPVCHKQLTEGVLYRVQQLASKLLIDSVEKKVSPSGILWYTHKGKQQPPYMKLVPLLEVVAQANNSTVNSQKVKIMYEELCSKFDSEINVLLKTSLETIAKAAGPRVSDGIGRVRRGMLVVDPGFDGEYGKVKLWQEETKEALEKEETLPQLGLGF